MGFTVFTIYNSGFMMMVFAPNKKNSSCQEMGGQYLRCCSMGTSLDERFKVQGSEVVNYDGWLLFRLLGLRVNCKG